MFIGRENELERLVSIASSLSDHRGAAVRLHGEPGIGKTALIQAYTQSEHHDDEFIYCRCLHSLFSDELTPLFNFAKARSNDMATLIERQADLPTFFSALLEFFMARKTRTVIVIEDAQWANGTMLSFLNYFGRRLVFSRCLLIISYRTSEISSEHRLHETLERIPSNLMHDIRLAPLSRHSLKQLSTSKREADKLYLSSGGNPLFISQLNLLGKKNLKDNMSIEDIIRSRIDKLDDNERTLIETLSVIPYPFTLALAERLDDSGLGLALLISDRDGFLTTDINNSLIFQHELLRKIILEQVSELRQVSLHRKILEAYGDLGKNPNLIWKLLHAHGASLAEEVINFSVELSKISSNINAHSEAADYLSIAISYAYTTDNETAAMLYESWAREASFAQDVSEKVFSYRQNAINLWKSLGRDDKVGENLYSLSRSHWFTGNSAQAQILADQAIKILEKARGNNLAAKAYSLRSQLCLLQNEHRDAIKLGRKALELEKLTNNNEVRTHALNNIGTSMTLSGDTAGRELLQQSLELAIKYELHEHISRGYVNFACCLFHTKELAAAEQLVTQGISYGTRNENHSKSSYLSGIAAQIRAEQGRLVDAKTIAAGLLASNEKTLIVLMPAQNTLARVFSLMANPAAEQMLHQALSKSLSIGEPQYTIAARFNLIEYAWINCKPELAALQIRKLTEVETSKLDSWRLGELDCWIYRFGFDFQLSGLSHSNSPYQLELNGQYLKASEAWEKLGIPLNQAVCLMLDRTREANSNLLEAYSIFKSHSAFGLISKVKMEADKLSHYSIIPKQCRGNSKDANQHPLGLTKREQEVLKQILLGKSNTEISNELTRSTRTIENHVSSILKKFNVKNRLEVILRTQNEPWLNLKISTSLISNVPTLASQTI